MKEVTNERIMEVAQQISIVMGRGAVDYDTDSSPSKRGVKPLLIANPKAIEKMGVLHWRSQEFVDWLTKEKTESGRKIFPHIRLLKIVAIDNSGYGKFIMFFERQVEPSQEDFDELGVAPDDLVRYLMALSLRSSSTVRATWCEGTEVNHFLRVMAPYCWGTPLSEVAKGLDREFYVVGRLDDAVFNDYWPVRRSKIEYIGEDLEIAEMAFSELETGEKVVDQHNFLGKLSTDGTVETIRGPQFI